jgi:hypothetical protein
MVQHGHAPSGRVDQNVDGPAPAARAALPPALEPSGEERPLGSRGQDGQTAENGCA